MPAKASPHAGRKLRSLEALLWQGQPQLHASGWRHHLQQLVRFIIALLLRNIALDVRDVSVEYLQTGEPGPTAAPEDGAADALALTVRVLSVAPVKRVPEVRAVPVVAAAPAGARTAAAGGATTGIPRPNTPLHTVASQHDHGPAGAAGAATSGPGAPDQHRTYWSYWFGGKPGSPAAGGQVPPAGAASGPAASPSVAAVGNQAAPAWQEVLEKMQRPASRTPGFAGLWKWFSRAGAGGVVKVEFINATRVSLTGVNMTLYSRAARSPSSALGPPGQTQRQSYQERGPAGQPSSLGFERPSLRAPHSQYRRRVRVAGRGGTLGRDGGGGAGAAVPQGPEWDNTWDVLRQWSADVDISLDEELGAKANGKGRGGGPLGGPTIGSKAGGVRSSGGGVKAAGQGPALLVQGAFGLRSGSSATKEHDKGGGGAMEDAGTSEAGGAGADGPSSGGQDSPPGASPPESTHTSRSPSTSAFAPLLSVIQASQQGAWQLMRRNPLRRRGKRTGQGEQAAPAPAACAATAAGTAREGPAATPAPGSVHAASGATRRWHASAAAPKVSSVPPGQQPANIASKDAGGGGVHNRQHSSQAPRAALTVHVSVSLKALVPQLTPEAAVQSLRMVGRLTSYMKYSPFWAARPTVSVTQSPAAWWQHAGRAIIKDCRWATKGMLRETVPGA